MNFRKLYKTAVAIGLSAIFLCGCKGESDTGLADSAQESVTESETNKETSKKETGDTENSDGEKSYEEKTDAGKEDVNTDDWVSLDESKESKEVSEDDLYLTTEDRKQIVLLGKDGSTQKVVSVSGNLAPDESTDDYIESVAGSKIFYVKDKWDGSKTTYVVSLYDLKTNAEALVGEYEEIPQVTYVDGDIYIDRCKYDSEKGCYVYSTLKYTAKDGGGFLNEEVYGKLNAARSDGTLSTPLRPFGHFLRYSTPYCINRYESAVYTSEDLIYVMDADGNLLADVQMPNGCHPEVMGFDGKNIVYEMTDSNYDLVGIYRHSIDKNKTEVIAEVSDYAPETLSVIDYDDEVVYICALNQEGEQESSTVYAYNLADKKMETVARESLEAGHGYLSNPLLRTFKVIGGKAYFLAEGDGTTEWYVAEKCNGKWEKKELDVVAKKYSYSEFGTVEAYRVSKKCPYCDQKYYEDYYEWLVMDSSIPNADKINSVFEAEMKERREYSENIEPTFTKEACEDYLHTGDLKGDDEDYLYIKDARKFLDHYLFIERSGYVYNAGAIHGYPVSANIVFDLDTGDEVSFKDIFDIPVGKLKKLVAQRAKDDFNKLEDSVFVESAEELYNQVYEETDLDFDFITYYDTYLTFDFQPYDLGSYASGVISLKISYEDLK